MLGNLHVRFGERDEETCPGNGARRFIPTLPSLHQGHANEKRREQVPPFSREEFLLLIAGTVRFGRKKTDFGNVKVNDVVFDAVLLVIAGLDLALDGK